MPRALKGRVLPPRRLRDGRTAIDVKIRDVQRTVGYEPEWNPERARELLRTKLVPMAILGQPWWQEVETTALAGRDGSLQNGASDRYTVEDLFSEYVAHVETNHAKDTSRNAYLAPIRVHVAPFFAYDGERLRLPEELTGPLVSAFTRIKQAEREELESLRFALEELDDATLRDETALRKQLDQDECELLRRYGQRGGRHRATEATDGRFSISTRGLSNNEINRCLRRLRDAIDLAMNDHALEIADPTRKRFLKTESPSRDILWPDQFQAVLDAADEIDTGTVRDIPAFTRNGGAGTPVAVTAHSRTSRYADLGRVEAILLLGLGGPRVSEFCDAVWEDLRPHGLWIPASKTHAGERHIFLHPIVRAGLEARKARRRPAPKDPIFPTATGKRRDRNSVRNRLLAPIHARAAELLSERGQAPLPARVTPHTYRRTYLTYLAWVGHPMTFARGQAGHTDSKLTLDIYQQNTPGRPDPRVVEWTRLPDDE